MRVVGRLVALSAVAALSACSFNLEVSLGANQLAPEDVEPVIANSLVEMAPGHPAPTIDCGTEPFPLEVGTTFTCALTVDGEDFVYDVAVEVTTVEGREFKVFFQVADLPRP